LGLSQARAKRQARSAGSEQHHIGAHSPKSGLGFEKGQEPLIAIRSQFRGGQSFPLFGI
jgi:hypothetical protein